jgi:NPCBM-associated, NEW3 domain of alpha-galactosidase
VKNEDGRLVRQPDELFLVIRSITSVLSEAKFMGEIPIADGVQAFLFDREGKGILVIWDKGDQKGAKTLALHLGAKPQVVDLWGNVTPLHPPRQDGTQSGQVSLPIGPMPIFLTDIDGELARLRASLAFDRPLIESSFKSHLRKVRFTNPYRLSISGTLRLKAPDGWNINPSSFAFTANPGETFEKDITIDFPYSTPAGPKTIHAQFEFQADRVSSLAVPMTLTLGLSDVGMQTMALRDGNAVLVQQTITNYGDKPINYMAFAIVPGQARQERLVSNLAPGRTTIKLYRFANAGQLANTRLRVGVKEQAGSRILNDEVEVQ